MEQAKGVLNRIILQSGDIIKTNTTMCMLASVAASLPSYTFSTMYFSRQSSHVWFTKVVQKQGLNVVTTNVHFKMYASKSLKNIMLMQHSSNTNRI